VAGVDNPNAFQISFGLEGTAGSFSAGSYIGTQDGIKVGTLGSTVIGAGTWASDAENVLYGPSRLFNW